MSLITQTHLAHPYRQDIQALRAVAILLVVAHHAKLPWLSGGFVGVDVFFVISGFLITELIQREIQHTNQFQAKYFYAARIKRLFPALLFVLVSSAILCFFLEPIAWQNDQIRISEATLFWWSNFYFAFRELNYFSPELDHSYLLHTWSLGVEEQFYLFWPWIILFLLGYWRWQRQTQRSYNRLVVGMTILGLVSFLTSLILSLGQVQDSFFLMPTRMWEFVLGGCVACIPHTTLAHRFVWLTKLKGRYLLNSIGLIFIFVSAFCFSGDLSYPGAWALLPCLGAVLILIDQVPNAHSRFFWHAPWMHYVGNISYSWYLWHWPILVFGTRLFGESAFVVLLCTVVGFLLAVLTYHVIEQPIRHIPKQKLGLLFGSAIAALLIAYLGLNYWSSKLKQLSLTPELQALTLVNMDLPIVYQRGCDSWFRSSELKPCEFGSSEAKKTVVLLGDSTVAMWMPAFVDIFVKQKNWKLIVLTKSACPLQDTPIFYQRIKREFTECEVWRHLAFDYLKALQPQLIITGGMDYQFTEQETRRGLQQSIHHLMQASTQLWILAPTPKLSFHAIECIEKKFLRPGWLRTQDACSEPLSAENLTHSSRALSELKSTHDTIKIVQTTDIVCPELRCHANIKDQMVYRDKTHLTASFVRSRANELEKILPALNLENDAVNSNKK